MNWRSTRAEPVRLRTAKPLGAQVLWGLSFLLLLLGVTGCLTPSGVYLDPTASPVLATQMADGLFLTTARLGGQEVGPFILDTGATHVVLDAVLARTVLPGLGGMPPGAPPVRRGLVTTIAVGPLVLQDIAVAVRDLSAASVPFGRPLAGLLGYPLFARTVVVVDYAQRTVACFDPRTYQLPSGNWMPLAFQAHRPVLSARLEGGRVGQFLLDTGSNSTVLFYPDFVRTQGLHDTRWTIKGQGTFVDGPHDTETAQLAWFEFAGVRFDRLLVAFARPDQPGPPGVAGIIGARVLQRFTVIFNYAASKIALLPNEQGR